MAQIGQFTRTERGFEGHLKALGLDAELTLVPAEPSESQNAPDYRVLLGDEEGLTSERVGRMSATAPANTSPSRSKARCSRARFAPISFAPAATAPSGACTPTVLRSSAGRTER